MPRKPAATPKPAGSAGASVFDGACAIIPADDPRRDPGPPAPAGPAAELLASPSSASAAVKPPGLITLRKYQRQVFRHRLRRLFLLWCRQKGKSHTLASDALDRMMARRGHLVTFISASITLGSEVLLKEAQLWLKFLELLKTAAERAGKKLTSNVDGLDLDAVADVFEHSKLQTTLWHSQTTFSRSRVIAPNPDTAVGWTGDIYGDEVGRWPDPQAVFEAIGPFMDSNPELIMRLATTPPPDDKHYSFELFQPPHDDWETNPKGNWYRSPSGIMVHRLDAWDADAAGVPLYHPDTGVAISPEEHRSLAVDKSEWDRNRGLMFTLGGTAAISTGAIQRAQVQGRGFCLGANITEPVILGEAA